MTEKPRRTRIGDSTTTRRGTRSVFAKIPARTAAEICQRFSPGERARALLQPESTPRRFVDLLIEKGEYEDAVRFLAHALPKPEAIWWAVRCVREVASGELSPKAAASLEAATKWLSDPSDQTRRAALPAAQAAGLETAAGGVALGVFFTGGSLGPPSLPPLPPEEHLTARVVAGSVILAAAANEPGEVREKYKACLAAGIEVARGASRSPVRPEAARSNPRG